MRLGTRARRAAALALAAAVAAGVCGAFALPLARLHRAYDERLAALRAGLEAQQRLARGRAEAERRLQEHRRDDPARPYYLAEASPALAAAELQGLVKRAVSEARGELISTQVLAAQAPGRLREVAVGVRARGDVRALQAMLYELESGLPLVFVERLSVEAQAGGELVIAFDASAHRPVQGAGPRARAEPRALFPFAPLQQYAPVAERTLFEPSRRASAPAAPPGVALPAPQGVSLAGLLLRAKRKVALVQRAGAAELIGLEPGDELDGWRLVEVRVDRIVLRRGAHARELLLRE